MFLVECEELKINHLTPLLVVTMNYACWFLWRAYYIEDFKWCLHFQFGVAFWRVFLREVYFWRAELCLKGIEDFNLEHWVVAFKRSLCLMTGNKTISSRFGKEEGEVLEVTKTSHDTMKPQLKVLSPYLGHAKSNNIFYFVLSTFNIGIAWWKIQNALSEQHATMRKYLSTRQHTTIL